MMKKERNLRLAVTGILLLTIVAAGVGLYKSANDDTSENPSELQQEELAQQDTVEEEITEIPESEDVTTPNAEAKMEETEQMAQEEPEEESLTAEETVTDTVDEVLPALDFTEYTVMNWPVQGDVLIDYSMDGAVYFPTLEVYKYNPAIILSAEENQEVQAAADSKVVSITENEETGITVTMDMGNGYQASYGQLQNVTVVPDQIVPEGTVIATVAMPTKYYTTEGTNLYFSMTKDGKAVDPVMYLETGEE